ncbi:hypothetical protein QBC41DRAFT_1313 [Cercophora samala]|uniref:Uncharacterized protein n=1 Tax=Cercophora samala TaxID=330535 RepID=A0AA39ZNL0_9PEZI|nr:hypothetical protein QBC41DRAFT_1313 [Cercophora samala]
MWAYAGMDQMGVSVSAAPLDRGGRVNYDCNQVRRCRWPGRYVEWEHCQRYTNTVGIKGKKGSSEELLLLFGNHLDSTTPEAGYNYGVCPWKEGDGPYFEGNHEPRLRNNYINAGEWLPWNDGVSFVLGTQRGVYWPHAPALTEMDTRRRPKKHVPPFRGDVLAVDFLRAQPQVVLAGTRSGHICQLDTRTAPEEWDRMVFRHKSSVAQLRSIGGFDVLAAGPRSAMCIYDLRFAKAREQNANEKPFLPWERNAVAPAVEFPGYRNEAHIKIGLDVLSQPGYGHGVVAAAHDDCTVGLYSLRDGSRIPSADVDKIKAPGVVKALMFQTLPHDQHPSLFVGVGSVIQKFSY